MAVAAAVLGAAIPGQLNINLTSNNNSAHASIVGAGSNQVPVAFQEERIVLIVKRQLPREERKGLEAHVNEECVFANEAYKAHQFGLHYELKHNIVAAFRCYKQAVELQRKAVLQNEPMMVIESVVIKTSLEENSVQVMDRIECNTDYYLSQVRELVQAHPSLIKA